VSRMSSAEPLRAGKLYLTRDPYNPKEPVWAWPSHDVVSATFREGVDVAGQTVMFLETGTLPGCGVFLTAVGPMEVAYSNVEAV